MILWKKYWYAEDELINENQIYNVKFAQLGDFVKNSNEGIETIAGER